VVNRAEDGDGPLVKAAQQGDPAAAEELVRRHWDTSHRTAFLIVQDASAAEDVCQEAMLAAVGGIDRVDHRRPFRPWLHRVVVNRALDSVRARNRRGEVTLPDDATERSGTDLAAHAVPDELTDALGALDPDQRAIVVLRHLLDYDSKEIGRMLDMPSATVRTRLRRSLDQLRAALDEGRERP
jgi:RNA polymerase sigma-70 factor (ECF subfamily)